MFRTLIYKSPEAFGLIKICLYKIFFGKDFKIKGIPRFSRKADIRIRKGCRLEIHDKCHITDRVSIRVASKGELILRKNVCVGQNSVITCHNLIDIGQNVMIGPNVTIYDHDHEFKVKGNMNEYGYVSEPVIIEDNVWIGSNVIILKGVTIGSGSVVAAGSLITRDVPGNSIIYNPRNTEIRGIDR